MQEVIVLVLLIPIFLMVGLPSFLRLLRAFRSRRWPSVKGTVIESRMLSGSKGAQVPLVVYKYKVQRRNCEADRICFEDDEVGDIARYPKGATVSVFYNPHQPDISVLENGLSLARSWTNLFVISLCLFLIGIPVVALVLLSGWVSFLSRG